MNKVIDLFKRFTRKKDDAAESEANLMEDVAAEVEDEILTQEEKEMDELEAAKKEHHKLNEQHLSNACMLFNQIGLIMKVSETQDWLNQMSDFVLDAHPDKSLRFTVDELIFMGIQRCRRVTRRRAAKVLEKYGFCETRLRKKMKAKTGGKDGSGQD